MTITKLNDSSVYKYELKLDKAIKISLPDCYSLFLPSQSNLQAYLTTESLRELLVTLGLIINEGYNFDIDFVPCIPQLEWFSGNVIIDEEIDGREKKMELFIKQSWGFYSTEMIISEWVNYLIDMISEYKQSFKT